jgi:hypothetical protein
MEMVSIPLSALQSSLEYFTEEAEKYEDNIRMREWLTGRASAYKALIELWHTPTV